MYLIKRCQEISRLPSLARPAAGDPQRPGTAPASSSSRSEMEIYGVRSLGGSSLSCSPSRGRAQSRNADYMHAPPTVVDCAEGTVRQFAQQPYRHGDFRSRLRLSQVSRIFITHMHGKQHSGLRVEHGTTPRTPSCTYSGPHHGAPHRPPQRARHPQTTKRRRS